MCFRNAIRRRALRRVSNRIFDVKADMSFSVNTSGALRQRISRASAVKPLFVILVLGGGLTVVAASPLRHYVTRVTEIQKQFSMLGCWGPPLYIFGAAVLIGIGFPRVALLPLAGLIFGFWMGLAWTQLATVLGYYALFMFARWGGREFVARHFPRIEKMRRVFHEHAIPTIVLLRQLPISGFVVNLLLGLSPITHWDFLIGTALGTLPEAIPLAWIGSAAGHLSRRQSVAWVAATFAFVLVIWLFFLFFVRRTRAFNSVALEFGEVESADSEGE